MFVASCALWCVTRYRQLSYVQVIPPSSVAGVTSGVCLSQLQRTKDVSTLLHLVDCISCQVEWICAVNNGCVLFDWPDPVGPGFAVLFRRPQAKRPARPGPTGSGHSKERSQYVNSLYIQCCRQERKSRSQSMKQLRNLVVRVRSL